MHGPVSCAVTYNIHFAIDAYANSRQGVHEAQTIYMWAELHVQVGNVV